MNIFKFFSEIGSYTKSKGFRGTTSGKLYVDKSVFYKRADVQKAIKELKESPVLKSQLSTDRS